MIVSAFSAPARAQTPSFEVASIKENKTDTNRVSMNVLPGGRWVATNVSLATLISGAYGDTVPLPPNRVVLPREWAGSGTPAGENPAPAADANAVSIFTAVREQLGLRLESGKQQVDVLVVDHAERPTEN